MSSIHHTLALDGKSLRRGIVIIVVTIIIIIIIDKGQSCIFFVLALDT